MSAAEEEATLEPSFFRLKEEERIEPAPGLASGKVVGDFRLVEMIGQGGMGQVWEAEQLTLKRRVAVKFVRPERVTAKQLELFAREARAGGRLHHPGIVTVYGYGQSDGLAWIAMEFIGGAWTLKDFLDDVARAPETPHGYERHVARFVAEVAEAMHTAHEAGVIHRDLKPQNILITTDDHPKVTDFGLARITDESALSQTGDFAGTYFYMSPEQVTAKRIGIDHRSDVFSLGVVLYELLALRRPFEGDTTHQVAEQIVMQDPPDPRTIRSKVPRDLSVIAGKALEKSRDKRYQTMKEFAADLRRYLFDEPILAMPPGAFDRALKWVRRHPARSSVAGVVLVALVVISVLLLQNVRGRRDLARSYVALEDKSKESEARRVLAEDRAEQVLRLSDLQDVEDLVHAADDLWPARPANIDRYRAWIEEAGRLVDKLPAHRETLAQLRSHALPRTEEERRAERESHPDWASLVALEGELAFRRRALLERRDGIAAELPAIDWSRYPDQAIPLNEVAWPMVDPARKKFGDELLGFALAQRAFERAAEGEKHIIGDTLAWALHDLGRDDEALKASTRALEAAPKEKKAEFEGYLKKLEPAVEEASSSEALRRAEAEVDALEAKRAELDARVDARRDWRFPEDHQRWWNNQLEKLIAELEALAAGLLAPETVTAEHGWSIPKRLAFAERLRDGFAPGGEYARAWDAVLPALRTEQGFVPQLGLVPLGKDPASGLWEFADLQTGVPARRGADGRIVVSEETGLVFILLPGGSFLMGSQDGDPARLCFDRDRDPDEGPVREVTLSPFFLSKYEMTQAQWERFAGTRPSQFGPGNWSKDWNPGENTPPLTHPVEKVSWNECIRQCMRLALSLPSEAQWEFAARAGTQGEWWFGSDAAALATAGNIADQQSTKFLPKGLSFARWNDGAMVHVPVDAQDSNPFGLFGMLGNVMEWCADGYYNDAYGVLPSRDPVAPLDRAPNRVRRGGAFNKAYTESRSANRGNDAPDTAVAECGLRPARALDPR